MLFCCARIDFQSPIRRSASKHHVSIKNCDRSCLQLYGHWFGDGWKCWNHLKPQVFWCVHVLPSSDRRYRSECVSNINRLRYVPEPARRSVAGCYDHMENQALQFLQIEWRSMNYESHLTNVIQISNFVIFFAESVFIVDTWRKELYSLFRLYVRTRAKTFFFLVQLSYAN